MDPRYEAQVRLLVQVLPAVASVKDFALKGGTAINLFHFNLPRLSVDIDLTYLPVQPRKESLSGISSGLGQIAENINALKLPDVSVARAHGGDAENTRLLVKDGQSVIKVETSPVMRGTIHNPEVMMVQEEVEKRFGFAEIQVVDQKDLFAGKMVAAFDRQHPRDLYDMMKYMEMHRIGDELLNTFLAYACFSNRPLHEILFPNAQDLEASYEKEFKGMTAEAVSLEELQAARKRLFSEVQGRLDPTRLDALASVLRLDPDLDPIGMSQVTDLPAFKWKQINLAKLQRSSKEKFELQEQALRDAVETFRHDGAGGFGQS